MAKAVRVFTNKVDLARAFGDILSSLPYAGNSFYLALSGGSTPRDIFDVLATEYITSVNWGKAHFFWGDERCVPQDHSDSNYLMAKEHLLGKIHARENLIFRVKGELNPEHAANDYSVIIENNLPIVGNAPQFDLIMLGVGDDGHTASIFPGQTGLWASPRSCVVATHPVSGQQRVSITGKVINNSKQVVLIVTGKNKAAVVSEIINKRGNYRDYPASMVDENKAMWLLDNEAASLL